MSKKLEFNKENLEYSKKLIKIMYNQITSDEEVLKRFLEIIEEFLGKNTKLNDLDKISKDPFINRRMRHPTRIKYIFGRINDPSDILNKETYSRPGDDGGFFEE